MIKQKRALAEEETQRKQKKTRVGGKLRRREKLRGESELMVSVNEVWSKEWGFLKTLSARFLILICTLCIFSVLRLWIGGLILPAITSKRQFKYFPRGK